MSLSWPQGHTHSPLPITLATQAGTPLDLTGVSPTSITVKLRPNSPVSSYVPLVGTVAIPAPTLGQITYTFAPADVALFGAYKLTVTVTYGANDEADFYEIDFLITQTR
jgi:hypothetical protein